MNKPILVAALALSTLYNTIATAQPFIKGKQEVTASYGYWTEEQVMISIEEPYNTDMIDYTDRTLYTNVAQNVFGIPYDQQVKLIGRQRTGAIFCNYLFSPIGSFSAGIGAGYQGETANFSTRNPVNGPLQMIGSYTRRIFTIAPEIRVSYGYNDIINFYGLLGLGRSFYTEKVSNDANGTQETSKGGFWMFQVSPIGIKVGKKIAGFVEGGFGYKGLVRGGVSFRF